jgi:hypothetical protein
MDEAKLDALFAANGVDAEMMPQDTGLVEAEMEHKVARIA